MNKKEDRLNQLINIVITRKVITISDAAKLFNVSEMTIRRDLISIEKMGIGKNVNGVIVSQENASNDLPAYRDYILSNEVLIESVHKRAIGKYAASLIEKDDSIIFDIGSTTQKILSFLDPDMPFNALCFTKNSLDILVRYPKIDIAFSGGYYYPKTQLFTSNQGVNFINNLRANKVFISTAGIHPQLGLSCVNSYEVPIKRACLKSAKQHILVTDSGKFDQVRSAYFCDLSDIDMIITDDHIPPDWIQIIKDMGITLKIVISSGS